MFTSHRIKCNGGIENEKRHFNYVGTDNYFLVTQTGSSQLELEKR